MQDFFESGMMLSLILVLLVGMLHYRPTGRFDVLMVAVVAFLASTVGFLVSRG